MGIDTNRYSRLIDSWLGFRGYLSVLFTLDTMYTIIEYFPLIYHSNIRKELFTYEN